MLANPQDHEPPCTRPSMMYFHPYRQTVIGSLIVGALVAALVLGVQWLLAWG